MKYGFFDDAAKEYVITRPDTPLPWINYLGNEGFFSLISNTCGGYSFYRDAKLRRITRFRYNDVPTDDGGRAFYICDGETVWSPAYLPARTPLDGYRCRHGLGYSVFEGEKDGVRAELTVMVPMGADSVEDTISKEYCACSILLALTAWQPRAQSARRGGAAYSDGT